MGVEIYPLIFKTMNREFFKGLDTTPEWGILDPFYPKEAQSEKELFCTKVRRVCKELRKDLTGNGHHLPWTCERQAKVWELCDKEGIKSELVERILFGDVEQTKLF